MTTYDTEYDLFKMNLKLMNKYFQYNFIHGVNIDVKRFTKNRERKTIKIRSPDEFNTFYNSLHKYDIIGGFSTSLKRDGSQSKMFYFGRVSPLLIKSKGQKIIKVPVDKYGKSYLMTKSNTSTIFIWKYKIKDDTDIIITNEDYLSL